jgi:dinuclear metal center YbgI/SA1388 family protein
MIKIKDLLNAIDNLAPFPLQEKYDNAGLLIGDPENEVRGVLLSLDCIESVVDEAIEKNCNVIVSHHPILFGSIKSLTGKDYVERVLIKAIKNDIALIAAHTNLDNVRNGVNDLIADKLRLVDRSILAPMKEGLLKLVVFVPGSSLDKVRQAMWNAGAGAIGNYDECSFNIKGSGTFKPLEGSVPFTGKINSLSVEEEVRVEVVLRKHSLSQVINAMRSAHPYEEVAYDVYPLLNEDHHTGAGLVGSLTDPIEPLDFLKILKDVMNAGCIRYTSLPVKKIRKVALCGGSGSFLLSKAIKAEADIFITADYKYHQFFDADDKIIIADIGHFESEQFTPHIFYGLIKKNFSNFAVHLSERITNPVNYL